MPIDSDPEVLEVEIEISTVWTDVSTDYVMRGSVRREAPSSSGNPSKFYLTLVQRGGGLAIHELQRIRVRNPVTTRYLHTGYIVEVEYSSNANEKLWTLTCEDSSYDLWHSSDTLPTGYIVAAGTSDRDAIFALMPLCCPEIGKGGVNTVISSLPELDLSDMLAGEALQEIQKWANSSQLPDFGVFPDASGVPQLGWWDWNNATHTPTLAAMLVDTVAPDATHVNYENYRRRRSGREVITKQKAKGANSAEGVIDGSIDLTAPHTFTVNTGTDVLTTSTPHGLLAGAAIYVESTTTLPAPLAIDTVYYLETVPTATTATLARAPVVARTVYAEPTTDRLWLTSHLLLVGWEVKFSTTGGLPAPLVAGTRYFVVEKTDNSFKVGATLGGAVIDITTEGTGVHSVTPATVDITSAGSGTHTLYDIRFDSIARDAFLYYGSKNFSGPVVKSDQVTTNHEGRLLARSIIHKAVARDTVALATRTQIDPQELGGPRKVLIQNTLDGLATTDPAWPIVRSTMDFSDGTALWALEVGDRFTEFGDDKLSGNTGGQQFAGDVTAPAVPTWPSGTTWILENQNDPEHLGYARLRVLCNANTEGDMWRYWFLVIDTTNGRTYFPAPVYHSQTDIDLTAYNILAGVNVEITVRAEDTSGNYSADSLPARTTTAEPLPSPTLFNPGYEIAHPFDSTRAFGWLVTLGGGGAVARSTTQEHSGEYSYRLDATSGVALTAARITSRYVIANASMRHRFSVWAYGEFPSMGVLTVKVHWYTAALVLISTTTLVTNGTIQNAWSEYQYFADAPSTAYALKVEVANNVVGSTGFVYVDDVGVSLAPPPGIYNGDFEISVPGNPAAPNGWDITIVGSNAQVVRADGDSYRGQYGLEMSPVGGGTDTATILSRFAPVGGSRPLILQYARRGSTTNGRLTITVKWYDSALAFISDSVVVSAEATPTAMTYRGAPVTSPATARYAKVEVLADATAFGMNIFIDAINLQEDPTDMVTFPIATTSVAGIVELATDAENAANVAVQGNDSRINYYSGTLPGSPVTGKPYFYSGAGTNVWVYWDGSQWLTCALHDYPFKEEEGAGSGPYAATTIVATAPYGPYRSYWWQEIIHTVFVATTNGASDYWTIRFSCRNAGTQSVILDISTNGDAPNTHLIKSANSGFAFNPLGLTQQDVCIELRKVGSPGAITYKGTLLKGREVHT